MAYSFNYEWYTVDILESVGRTTLEVKATNRGAARRQIQKIVDKQNKDANNKDLPFWKRGASVKEIYWETMKLDRVGHNR